jgi:hypothetical protein
MDLSRKRLSHVGDKMNAFIGQSRSDEVMDNNIRGDNL